MLLHQEGAILVFFVCARKKERKKESCSIPLGRGDDDDYGDMRVSFFKAGPPQVVLFFFLLFVKFRENESYSIAP